MLVLSIVREAFRTIKCYYSNRGTKEELIAGKEAISWIKNMGNLFKEASIACGMNTKTFHQKCLRKINQIKREVEEEKHGQANMASQN